MKIITRQTLAQTVPSRFEKIYGTDRESFSWKTKITKGQLIDQLNSLSIPVDPDKVDQIIGNTSWTCIECHECGNLKPLVVVEVGQPPDYESHTANICIDCLQTALNLAR